MSRVRKFLVGSVIVIAILASAVVVKAMLTEEGTPPPEIEDTTAVEEIKIDFGDDLDPLKFVADTDTELR